MSDISDYTVVSSDRQDTFLDGVKDLLAKGWEPQGGIALHKMLDRFNGQAVHYSQAMVKRQSARRSAPGAQRGA